MTSLNTIAVPDTWITEDGYLYLIHNAYVGLPALADRANQKLAESDYSHRFNASTLLAAREQLWVDPAFIMDEQWPPSAVVRKAKLGWVRVLCVDLDSFSE
jgi:hypothetical protein